MHRYWLLLICNSPSACMLRLSPFCSGLCTLHFQWLLFRLLKAETYVNQNHEYRVVMTHFSPWGVTRTEPPLHRCSSGLDHPSHAITSALSPHSLHSPPPAPVTWLSPRAALTPARRAPIRRTPAAPAPRLTWRRSEPHWKVCRIDERWNGRVGRVGRRRGVGAGYRSRSSHRRSQHKVWWWWFVRPNQHSTSPKPARFGRKTTAGVFTLSGVSTLLLARNVINSRPVRVSSPKTWLEKTDSQLCSFMSRAQ